MYTIGILRIMYSMKYGCCGIGNAKENPDEIINYLLKRKNIDSVWNLPVVGSLKKKKSGS